MSPQQRQTLRTLGAIAAFLGAGAVLFPRAGAAALGMPAAGPAAWGLRLFGVRELCLAFGLLRAARDGETGQARLMADLVTVAQAGDAAVALVMLSTGSLSRRAALVVLAGVAPTLIAARRAAGRPPN